MSQEILPNFQGKVVAVYIKDNDNPAILENPTFENQGGRLFLVGRYTYEEWFWVHNLPCGVAWDQVECYFVFDSVDDYLARMNRKRPTKGKKKKKSKVRKSRTKA